MIKIPVFFNLYLIFGYILLQIFCSFLLFFEDGYIMGTLKEISKCLIIILVGSLLAFFVAWIQYDTTDLSASVLSLTEQDFFVATKRDAGYKKENQIFEVFLSEQVRKEWLLTVSILYSPDDIQWFTDKIDTKYLVNIIEQNEWNLILNVDGYENGDLTSWIFEIPYSWDSKDITLEYIKSKSLEYSIGSLDNIEKNQIH